MLEVARRLLLAAVLMLASCTFQYRERHAFSSRKTFVLTETIERHNVELKQAGETTLRGWYLTPKAPRHHLVYFYGSNGSVVAEYAKLHWLAQTYDMDILVVDFPGYGFSDGSPSVAGLARASLRIHDAMAERWPNRGGPIFVYGHSMGTAFAVHVGVNRPGTAIILEAPFTSIQDLVAAMKHRLPWHARLFLTIKIDDALTRWRQPVDLIKELARPLLIIHGSNDQAVPVAQGQRMFAAALTTRKHLCELPGADHFPVQPNPDRRTDLSCLTAFLRGHGAPATMPSREAKPDFAGKLPARVGGWKKPTRPALYDRKTLHDYIDGGAELYRAFDFVDAVTFEYSAGKDDTIKVDIFDMGSPRGAFGVFAHGRESIAAEVGQGSDHVGGLLTFWKHRWFVSLLGYPETPAKRKAVYELGRAIAALIPKTGSPPAILAALPRPGLVEASVRSFHHHLLQNDYVTLSLENPLAIGPRTEAVLARYARQGQRHVLMLVDYPNEDDARNAERGFTKIVLGGAAAARKGDRWTAIKRSGKRLVIVPDAPSRQVANQVLSEVP